VRLFLRIAILATVAAIQDASSEAVCCAQIIESSAAEATFADKSPIASTSSRTSHANKTARKTLPGSWKPKPAQPKPEPADLSKTATTGRAGVETEKLRVWKSGGYTTAATLESVVGQTVTLRKSNGTTVRVPINILSKEDQQYIQVREEKRKSAAGAQPPPGLTPDEAEAKPLAPETEAAEPGPHAAEGEPAQEAADDAGESGGGAAQSQPPARAPAAQPKAPAEKRKVRITGRYGIIREAWQMMEADGVDVTEVKRMAAAAAEESGLTQVSTTVAEASDGKAEVQVQMAKVDDKGNVDPSEGIQSWGLGEGRNSGKVVKLYTARKNNEGTKYLVFENGCNVHLLYLEKSWLVAFDYAF